MNIQSHFTTIVSASINYVLDIGNRVGIITKKYHACRVAKQNTSLADVSFL